MDRKFISYVVFLIGVILLLIGGGLLYLKEKNIKAPEQPVKQKSKKVEVIYSTHPITNQTVVKPQQPVETSKPILATTTQSKTQKRKIAFKYRSSKPETVFLIGDFNKWNNKANPMKKGENFTWETTILLSPGEYKYAFLVDNKQINDAYNKRTIRVKSGKASVLTVKSLP